MDRPHIICHMVASLDGKVTGSFLRTPEAERAAEIYYGINRDLKPDAFACGRISMEESFTGGWQPDLAPFRGVRVPREDVVAQPDAGFFAVAFDRRGRLGWREAMVRDEDPGYDSAHIVEVLCEDAPDERIAYLRSIGVSCIFAGKTELDLPLALRKLREKFGIRNLALEGGSVLNGAFFRAGVIDELSLVTAPVMAAADALPLFDGGGESSWQLQEARVCDGGVLALRCRRKEGEA